jgi:hypothetical protein
MFSTQFFNQIDNVNRSKIQFIMNNFTYTNEKKSIDDFLNVLLQHRQHIFNSVIKNDTFYKYYCYPNIISNDICDFIINESEKYAENNKSFENPSGWTHQRHKKYPTTDLPIKDITNLSTIVTNIINYDVLDKIVEKYNINKYFLDLNDIFIVKYTHDTQNSLEDHRDGSEFSFNILLNSPQDFEGGGTIFINNNNNRELVSNTKGGLIIHSGKQLHAGNKITKGQRYILVGFVSYLRHIKIEEDISKHINNLSELKLSDTNTNLNSWTIESANPNDNLEINNFIESDTKINIPSSLLNTDKNEFNMIEKYVYELAMFHFERLNIVFDKNKHYIEFWYKNENKSYPNNIIHNFHADKDELFLQKNKKLVYPLLSTITYLTDSNCPTTISEIPYHHMNEYQKYNNEIILSFPKKMKHIAFNGLNLHGVFDIFNEKLEVHNISNRKTLMFNLWESHSPTDRIYFNNTIPDTIFYEKNNNLIKKLEQKNNNTEIKVNEQIINYILLNLKNKKSNYLNYKNIINEEIINNNDIIKIQKEKDNL